MFNLYTYEKSLKQDKEKSKRKQKEEEIEQNRKSNS
jgi:hypothetical protein